MPKQHPISALLHQQGITYAKLYSEKNEQGIRKYKWYALSEIPNFIEEEAKQLYGSKFISISYEDKNIHWEEKMRNRNPYNRKSVTIKVRE